MHVCMSNNLSITANTRNMETYNLMCIYVLIKIYSMNAYFVIFREIRIYFEFVGSVM